MIRGRRIAQPRVMVGGGPWGSGKQSPKGLALRKSGVAVGLRDKIIWPGVLQSGVARRQGWWLRVLA